MIDRLLHVLTCRRAHPVDRPLLGLTWGPPWGGGTNWGDMRGLASGLLRYDKPPKLASTLRGGGHFPKCTFFGHFDRGLSPETLFAKVHTEF